LSSLRLRLDLSKLNTCCFVPLEVVGDVVLSEAFVEVVIVIDAFAEVVREI